MMSLSSAVALVRVLLGGLLFNTTSWVPNSEQPAAVLRQSGNLWPAVNNNDPKPTAAPQCGISSYEPPAPQPPILFNNSNSQQNEYKIIHGHLVPNGSCLPWMASLNVTPVPIYQNFSLFLCSATIIGPLHVLTAAHCLSWYYVTMGYGRGHWPPRDTDLIRVHVGHTDLRNKVQNGVKSKRMVPHPNFTNHLQWHPVFGIVGTDDIAIIELSRPLEFNATVQPICLSRDKTTEQFINKTATIAGWGAMNYSQPIEESTALRDGLALVAPAENCSKFNLFDESKNVCTVGVDVTTLCQGDSGGPLLIKKGPVQWEQIGVASMGFGKHCLPPNVFTRVSNYCEWIATTTNQTVLCRE